MYLHLRNRNIRTLTKKWCFTVSAPLGPTVWLKFLSLQQFHRSNYLRCSKKLMLMPSKAIKTCKFAELEKVLQTRKDDYRPEARGGALPPELAIYQTNFFWLSFLRRLRIRVLLFRLGGRFPNIGGQSPNLLQVS